jgi:hypothetical protein
VFDTYLHNFALTYGATGLTNATSTSVTTIDDSSPSDDNSKEKKGGGFWSVGVIIGTIIYFCLEHILCKFVSFCFRHFCCGRSFGFSLFNLC